MDPKLWAVLIGVLVGALGYFFTTFYMKPILRFHEIRNQILMDFIYFAQVINAESLNEKMQALYEERILANRKASARLSASVLRLPSMYLFYLKYKGIEPQKAATHLIGFSNTNDYVTSNKKETAIRKALGLPYDT